MKTVPPNDEFPADLDRAGARHFPGAAVRQLDDLHGLANRLPPDRAGSRLHDIPGLSDLLENRRAIGGLARRLIGPKARAVRAILFGNSPRANWSLAWHQDRTICVRRRIETPGFTNWAVKQGAQHVAPPISLLAGMVTLRVHLDDVPEDNAPLLIAPGSHQLGLIPECRIDEVVARCGTLICTARAGDIWAYATPILHASEAAQRPSRRRVLQVDFAAADLPGTLEWSGI